jgi:hypothetical protein
MGMITVHFALGLFNLTREWLPHRQLRAHLIARRQGRLHLHPRHRPTALPQVNLVYLGLAESQLRFRLDIQTRTARRHVELTIRGRWDSTDLLAQDRDLAADARLLALTVEVVAADAQSARVRLTTPLAVRYELGRDAVGLSMSDLLLPGPTGSPQAQLITWLLRAERVSLAAAAHQIGQTPAMTRVLLDDLVQQGLVREVEENGCRTYELRLALTRSHRLADSLAAAVAHDAPDRPTNQAAAQHSPQASAVERLLDRLFSERGRFLLGLTSMVLVFLAAEALLITGNHSFTGALSFIGVIVIAMLGGVYPVLLVQAGRQTPGGRAGQPCRT